MLGFWIFMLVMDMLLPLTMIGFGRMFLKNAPKDINTVFGYRTKLSMKNKDTWEFAHKYCGKLWFRIGLVILPFSVVPLLFVWNKNITTVGIVGLIVTVVQLVPLVGSILPVETALRKTFDENGMHR